MMRGEGSSVIRGSRGHGPGVKKSKPAMEKRRRARINASLAELRSLIPDSVKRGNRRYSKMEKADILEMAVQYLRLLQDSNKNKNQVSTVSYSLGFNECTQEVSEFFRSSSPATTRFKGSLLDHLNDCAPNNTPDSPSSSPTTIARRSISSTFSASSIIARCLLSSTPEKVSRNARNSPAAAVSSTSDESSSERVLLVPKGAGEDNLGSSLEMTSQDPSDAPQVQMSEVFRVKKDLLRSFSCESRGCQPQTDGPRNESSTCNSAVPSSSTVPSKRAVLSSSAVPSSIAVLSNSAVPSNSAVSSNIAVTSNRTVLSSSAIPPNIAVPSSSAIHSIRTVPSSSAAPLSSAAQKSTLPREPYIHQTFEWKNQTEPSSTTIISAGEIHLDPADNVINTVPLPENDVPELMKESPDTQEECIAPRSSSQAATSPYGKTETKITDGFSSRYTCQLSPRSIERNSKSPPFDDISKIILSSPNTVSVTKDKGGNRFDAQCQNSDKINSNSLQSISPNVIAKANSNNDVYVKYNTLQNPASQSPSQEPDDATLPLEKHLPTARPSVDLESTAMPAVPFPTGASVPTSKSDLVKTTKIISGTSPTQTTSMPAIVFPIYFQTSEAGDFASFKEAIMMNSPHKKNISNPTLYPSSRSLQTTTLKDTGISSSDINLSLFKDKDNLVNTNQPVMTNTLSETANGGGSLFLQAGNASPNKESLSDTYTQIHNKAHDRATSIRTGAQAETILTVPNPKLFCHKINTEALKNNTDEDCTITKSLSSNSRATNFPSPVLTVTKSTSPSSSHLLTKRPLSDIDNISEELIENSKKVQDDNVYTLIKRLRLTQSNLHQSIFSQDGGVNSSGLSQYISTKFRPIAPKRDVNKMPSSDIHHDVHQRSPIQSKSTANNCFRSNSIFDIHQGDNVNPKIEHGHSAHAPSYTSSVGEGQHHTSPQSGNTKTCASDGSTSLLIGKDDILTTALKSSYPLKKTQFTVTHLNSFNKNQSSPTVGQDVPSISKLKNQSFINYSSSDDIHMCRLTSSSQQSKTAHISENFHQDKFAHDEVNSHMTVKCSRPKSIETSELFSSAAVKQLATPNSATKLSDSCCRCNDEDSFSTANESVSYSISPVQPNNSNCSLGTDGASHETSKNNFWCHQQKSKLMTSSCADLQIRQNSHRCLIFDFEDDRKMQNDSCKNSRELIYVTIPAHQMSKGKVWSSSNCAYMEDEKSSQELCNTQTSTNIVVAALDSPQPLNLSLRGPNCQTVNRSIKDTQFLAEECSQDLELQFKQFSNDATSALTCFPGDSPSNPAHHHSNHVYTKRAHQCNKFPKKHNMGMDKTIIRDTIHGAPSLYSVEPKEISEASMNADSMTHQSIFTNAGCRITLCKDSNMSPLQAFSEASTSINEVSPAESQNHQGRSVCNPPTKIPAINLNHGPNQELPFQYRDKSTLSQLSPLLQVSKMNGQMETADDDVWRPW